jgi:K+-sensing histidine kinase KdpD
MNRFAGRLPRRLWWHAAAAGCSVFAVAVVTAGVFALRPIAPVLSLGVLYVVAVVAVAVLFGSAYAIPTAFGSMLTFNFFLLPPLRTFALRDSGNWVALVVYIVVAVVVSELATRSRRLARKAVEAETLRQSDAVKTAILQSVSHDLRSPLTAIRAANEALASSSLALSAADRAELLETIKLEVQRLEHVVGNLLDLSRLDAGPSVRRPELWTIDTLLADALEQLGDKGARIRITLADNLPPTLVDGGHVERVLVNVLENALKFSPATDNVDVDVRSDDDRMRVHVQDHGKGVHVADRERIFEPFERGSADGSGTGLGLAIARGLAEANGGRLVLEDSSFGAAFVLELPTAEALPTS